MGTYMPIPISQRLSFSLIHPESRQRCRSECHHPQHLSSWGSTRAPTKDLNRSFLLMKNVFRYLYYFPFIHHLPSSSSRPPLALLQPCYISFFFFLVFPFVFLLSVIALLLLHLDPSLDQSGHSHLPLCRSPPLSPPLSLPSSFRFSLSDMSFFSYRFY